MSAPAITAGSYVPQDTLFVWALVIPAAPTLLGTLQLSQLVPDCATFAYDASWWQFPLSEDLPLVPGQTFSAGEKAWKCCCSRATTALVRSGLDTAIG